MARSDGGPPAIDVAEYPSKSSSKIHNVRISRVDGRLYCTCRGWGFHKECTHTKSVSKDQILAALEEACATGVLGF